MKRLILVAIFVLSQITLHAFTFAFSGDIMMGTTFPQTNLPEQDGALLFMNVSQTLQSADFTFGNLEGTLCDTDPQARNCGDPNLCYRFKTPQRYVMNLVNAGYDAVSIANNHVNDFGSEGRDSTISTLRKAGIAFTGLKNICETSVVVRNGKRIGVCSFSHNMVTVDVRNIEYAVQLVRSLRDSCDYVVVSFHGGGEGKKYLHVPKKTEHCFGEDRGDVYKFAHACIDAGADLVFGHGPHVPRGLELYNGHLIAYSLGNFCTPYGISITGVNGYAPLLFVEIDENGLFVKGRIESYVQQRGAGPVRDTTEQAAQLMKRLSSEDFPGNDLLFVGNELQRR